MSSPVKNKKERRKWTVFEDDKLIEALLNVHNSGKYTGENGLKPGYLQAVEDLLKISLPNSNIKARPHIESRRKSLKSDWGTVHDMLNGTHHSSSGFGFNCETKMITAEDEVWEAYVKSHPKAANWKNKPFRYYEDCCIILGKDRATGKDALSAADMVEDIEREDIQHLDDESPEYTFGNFNNADPNMDSNYDNGNRQKEKRSDESSSGSRRVKAKKTSESLANGIVKAAEILGEKLEKSAQEFAKALNSDSEKRGKIIVELRKIRGLTIANKISLATKIASNSDWTDIFLAFDDYTKQEWVDM